MFKTFPEFSKLTLADRQEYEAFIKDFPPVSDISFVNLMLWWDTLGGLALSRLNDNLVVSYWIPGDEVHSGLSLIGVNKVDESICAIFDHLREKGEEPRLINVPEFVANSTRYPDLFRFLAGRGDDEYVISLAKFADLERLPLYTRTRIRRFIRENGKNNLRVEKLDLAKAETRRLLLDCAKSWPLKGINDLGKLERGVLPSTIANSTNLGLQALGLFVDGEIQAYCLYFAPNDPRYVIVPHARANYDMPRLFDYMVHAFSEYLVRQGVEYVNIDADNGSVKLRALKIALKPDNFFRKYAIEPRGKSKVI